MGRDGRIREPARARRASAGARAWAFCVREKQQRSSSWLRDPATTRRARRLRQTYRGDHDDVGETEEEEEPEAGVQAAAHGGPDRPGRETRGDEQYHERITGLLRSSRSDREWAFTGEVMDLIPLRNRRQDPDGNWLMTRISEGMTKWTVHSGPFEGQSGYGLSEYLDQIIDDSPVGLAE